MIFLWFDKQSVKSVFKKCENPFYSVGNIFTACVSYGMTAKFRKKWTIKIKSTVKNETNIYNIKIQFVF